MLSQPNRPKLSDYTGNTDAATSINYYSLADLKPDLADRGAGSYRKKAKQDYHRGGAGAGAPPLFPEKLIHNLSMPVETFHIPMRVVLLDLFIRPAERCSDLSWVVSLFVIS